MATIRIGVTGLARAGKTAFLTSVAANLLALGAGMPALPSLASRGVRVSLAPAGAADIPRFDYLAHLAALAADPPRWPARTDAVSMLALDVTIPRIGMASALPPRQRRLEFLDYPGEWLLDLPLLAQDFSAWSASTLRRLEGQAAAAPFLGFLAGLPAGAAADEALALAGHRLYVAALEGLRDAGLRFLQPGRFLMLPPGPPRPWLIFFPSPHGGKLAGLLAARFDAYRDAVRADLLSPSFGRVDRLVVLADLLSALHDGRAAYADTATALAAAAGALRWQRGLLDRIPLVRQIDWSFLDIPVLSGGIRRVAFVASKADHVAQRQRGNLAALMRCLTDLPGSDLPTEARAIAAVRSTEDFVWSLDGRNVSAVRGRIVGQDRMTRSYPGEVPDGPPDDGYWAHDFLALPDFEPLRLPAGGRGGVPQAGLDTLLEFLLGDIL